MFNTIKFKTVGLRRMSVLGGLVFAAVLASLPVAAQAQCTNSNAWNAPGELYLYQDRMEKAIILRLEQKGMFITGTASTVIEKRTVVGRAHGTIDGDRFSIQIAWPDNLTGVYNGVILPTGIMKGGTYDKKNPKIQQAWRTEEPLKCAPPPATYRDVLKSMPPAPKPIKSGGKARPSAPAPPPTSPMKVPGIIASQVVFAARNVPSGFVVLQWDGGPDHPYAEVWFKVNNGEEAFLVEQGKGSRQVTVERGKHYTYILTDGGKTLSTVIFIVPPF